MSTIIYIARATPTLAAGSVIQYSLSSDDDGYFSIDQWTGEIRTRQPLDRESQAVHRLLITATRTSDTDGQHTGYLNIFITVLDSNDHSPLFSHPSYSCHVTRSSCAVCTVTATDGDEGLNGRLVYFLLTDDDSLDAFYIDPYNGTIYTNRHQPTTARRNSTLTVVAMDAGVVPRNSRALVVVTSDVSPGVNCAVSSRQMTIEENQPAFRVVGSVHLASHDGTNVPVTRYQLIQDGGQQTFDVNVKTGEIVTKLMIDREQQSVYSLSVTAVYVPTGIM